MLKEGDKVAVVGGGISGLVAAYLLQRKYQVTIYEKGSDLGGHTHTVNVSDPDLGEIGIDMGFIVLNDRNYPLLNKFFRELNVKIQPSEMSFGLYCDRTKFAYSGMSLSGVFANRSNFLNPSFYKFLLNLRSFCKIALSAVENNELKSLSLEEFLNLHRVSNKLRNDYLLPMGSAIWSTGGEGVLKFPAESFLKFFKNHGLLDFTDRPQWQTVIGGSSKYIELFKEKFKGAIRCNARVNKIVRDDTVTIRTADSADSYSAVVLATHAPTSLELLEEPSAREWELLSKWRYSPNTVSLHTDLSLLPPNRRAWASWNYRRRSQAMSELPTVTYWMNNLQSLSSRQTYCVTLNEKPAPEKTIKSVVFEHPVFNAASIATQSRFQKIQGEKATYYCGAYLGNGFHEDGCRAGSEVASLMGVPW